MVWKKPTLAERMDDYMLKLCEYVDAERMWTDADLAGFGEDQRADWAAQLRAAETTLRRFRQRVEPASESRRCATCGAALVGRADRRFCSTACRQAAHRLSRLQS